MEAQHCRFCAEAMTEHELLNWTLNCEVYQKCIRIIAALKLDYIDMDDANLPPTTCKACYNSLTSSYLFLEKVQLSQVKLKAIYQQPIKTEWLQTTVKTENILNTSSCNNVTVPNIQIISLPTTEVKSESVTSSTLTNIPLCEFSVDTMKQIKVEIDSSDILSTGVDGLLECKTNTLQSSTVNDMELSVDTTAYLSWSSYKWTCLHCKIKFENMGDLREHSKGVHDKCYAFTCNDCQDQFNTFNSFIEHVRQHRDVLRNYCQYCDQKFNDWRTCEDHALTHWSGTQKICFFCGEIFPDAEILDHHRKLYKVAILPKRCRRKVPKVVVPDNCYDGVSSWENYQWTCQECCVQMPDVHTLRTHAQDFHNKCFNMKCIDCLTIVKNYTMFVRHVRRHRPYLEKYCQYCNTYFNNTIELDKHVADHMCSIQKPCNGCGQIFENNSLLLQHLRKYDLTCDICGKVYQFISQLRRHRLAHDKDRKRDYVCYICGKSYFDAHMLSLHIKSHDDSNKTEVCQICNKAFLRTSKLRAHLKRHDDTKSFSCNECGKNFKTKSDLTKHGERHMKKNFICIVCNKSFASKSNLNTHMYTHSTNSPYSCKHCEKTFNSWGNCDKHMLRKHGVSLAKNKRTAQGSIDIDKETGKMVKLATSKEDKEWISAIMKPKRRGKSKRDEGS